MKRSAESMASNMQRTMDELRGNSRDKHENPKSAHLLTLGKKSELGRQLVKSRIRSLNPIDNKPWFVK